MPEEMPQPWVRIVLKRKCLYCSGVWTLLLVNTVNIFEVRMPSDNLVILIRFQS